MDVIGLCSALGMRLFCISLSFIRRYIDARRGLCVRDRGDVGVQSAAKHIKSIITASMDPLVGQRARVPEMNESEESGYATVFRDWRRTDIRESRCGANSCSLLRSPTASDEGRARNKAERSERPWWGSDREVCRDSKYDTDAVGRASTSAWRFEHKAWPPLCRSVGWL